MKAFTSLVLELDTFPSLSPITKVWPPKGHGFRKILSHNVIGKNDRGPVCNFYSLDDTRKKGRL